MERAQLPAKPFFQARTTEGVEAIKEGKGLVEHFRTNLVAFIMSAILPGRDKSSGAIVHIMANIKCHALSRL